MKLRRLKTTTVLLGLSLVVFASCGKTQTSALLGSGGYAASCDQSAAGDNVYTGDIVNSSYGTSSTGKLVLSVTETGGAIGNQFMATASLTVNGTSLCCTSLGNSVLDVPRVAGDVHTLRNVPLSCQPTSGSSYQTVTLKLGVVTSVTPIPGDMGITTDKRAVGCMEVSGGIQLGYGSNSTYICVK